MNVVNDYVCLRLFGVSSIAIVQG